MADKHNSAAQPVIPFFEQPRVETQLIPIADGIPLGIERITHPELPLGGAYGTWGECYDNETLLDFIEHNYGEPLSKDDQMELSELGFVHRHHVSELSDEENLKLEVEVGAKLLREAAKANGWDLEDVEGLIIGLTAPISDDYTERIAREAGIPESAIKVSIHKACDSSMGALHLALNPELSVDHNMDINIAEELAGKKVLVGGIEGLSRFVKKSMDRSAMQLFGNGAGVIGVVPGETMKFLVGKAHEAFDEKGVLAVTMYYPHSGLRKENQSNLEVTRAGGNHYRLAGLMHEPRDKAPVVMAGPMGMVKLFVRTGVLVVSDVFQRYHALMDRMGAAKEITVGIVHHANYKINTLKSKHLTKRGVRIPMPWLLSEFGNVSAASNMIAFLRQLSKINPGDHILFDGFGAGTYYDAFAVALGE